MKVGVKRWGPQGLGDRGGLGLGLGLGPGLGQGRRSGYPPWYVAWCTVCVRIFPSCIYCRLGQTGGLGRVRARERGRRCVCSLFDRAPAPPSQSVLPRSNPKSAPRSAPVSQPPASPFISTSLQSSAVLQNPVPSHPVCSLQPNLQVQESPNPRVQQRPSLAIGNPGVI